MRISDWSSDVCSSDLAERIGGGYRLTGTKTWITNAPIADVVVVWANSVAHGDAIRGFVVDRGSAGLSLPPIMDKLSLRASITAQVVLAGVHVPGENPYARGGRKTPVRCVKKARCGVGLGGMVGAEYRK